MNEYNLQITQELLKDFHNLTDIKICIYDNAENELYYYPTKHTRFCSLLRSNAALNEKCVQCDRHAFSECKKTHRQYRYTCHAGLLECVSPILYRENVLGFIVIGQIRTDDAILPREAISSLSPDTQKELEDLFTEIPVLALDKINSAVHILDACAGYEYLKSLVDSARIDTKIAAHIEQNLKDDLSVVTLCGLFRLSRNELYSIFREYFHSSVADFVKERRLRKAAELLEKTQASIASIATSVGFADYNYFTKQFKRKFGISPRNYRKSVS